MAVLRVALLLALAALCSGAKKKQEHLIPVIDIGDEYMKVAAVNPRKGYTLLDIALNEQSERKTPVVIGFEQDGEIRVGDGALALKVRSPTRTFYGFMELLGEDADGAVVKAFLAENPQLANVLVKTEENTVAFNVKEVGATVPVEVLLALFIRSILSRFTVGDIILEADNVKEVVLIVPEDFTPKKVGLLVQSAQLAGFTVRTLVPQLAAAILDYAVGGTNSGAGPQQSVLAYGMGGSSASAALFSVDRSQVKNDKKKRVVVRSESTAETVRIGGKTFTAKIAALLRAEFAKKSKAAAGLDTNLRALAKLARSAQEVKETLSFSPSASVTLENLHEKQDLHTAVTVKQFEEAVAQDATHRAVAGVAPIRTVLEAAHKDAAEITVCELFGGGLRIPLVAKTLAAQYPALTMGKHINGDEAAVFGAAYLVASAAQLPGATTQLVFEHGPQEKAQALASPPKPLSSSGLELRRSVIATLDKFEQARLLAQGNEDL